MSTSPFAPLFEGLDESAFLTLAQAASLLPGRRPGKRMSSRVLLRWVISGVRGHRLKTIRIGMRHVVRVADLRDFLDAIAPKSSWPERLPNPRLTERQRARRAEMMHRAAAILLGVPEKGR